MKNFAKKIVTNKNVWTVAEVSSVLTAMFFAVNAIPCIFTKRGMLLNFWPAIIGLFVSLVIMTAISWMKIILEDSGVFDGEEEEVEKNEV